MLHETSAHFGDQTIIKNSKLHNYLFFLETISFLAFILTLIKKNSNKNTEKKNT